MANNLFAKYLWEISTIERAGRITLRSLSEKWQRCHLGFNEELPRRTFDNHRAKIKELFNNSTIPKFVTFCYIIFVGTLIAFDRYIEKFFYLRPMVVKRTPWLQ